MYNKYTQTLAILSLIFCLSQMSSFAVDEVFARATKYHKTDKNCDPDTKKGLTSTDIKLKDSDENSIGMVAVDPEKIPYGSLVYSPKTNRFFLACDVGGAVINRTAAKDFSKKKGLSKKHQDALVLDFYSDQEIIDNHFCDFLVIKHTGDIEFYKLHGKYQTLRLDPEFWLEEIKEKENSEELEVIERALQNIPSSK